MSRTRSGAWVGVVCLMAVAEAQAQRAEPGQDRLNKQERAALAAPETSIGSEPGHAALPPNTAIPQLIRFSGVVKDHLGKPRTGVVGITFAIYKEPEGAAALWLETQNVELDEQGHYTVLLGATKSEGLPLELFSAGEPRWLGAQVNLPREVEQPRVLLVSVPYALKAKDAETLGGKPASAFVTTETLAGAGNSSGGSAAPSSSTVSTALPSSKTQTTSKKTASAAQPGVSCTSVTSDGTATASSIAKVTAACNIQNSTITETGGNVGIGTAAPAVALDVVGDNAGLRLSGTGTHQVTVTGLSSGRLGQDANGFFFASDTNGKSVRFLTNNGTLNEWMRITSAGNIGLGTTAPAAKLDVVGTGNFSASTPFSFNPPTGVLSVSQSGNGHGIVVSTATSVNGAAVFAEATNAAANAVTLGVFARAASIGAIGVNGSADNSLGVGVMGSADGPGGRGVVGHAGIDTNAGIGVFGSAGNINSVAGQFGNESGGNILIGTGPGVATVFRVDGAGKVFASGGFACPAPCPQPAFQPAPQTLLRQSSQSAKRTRTNPATYLSSTRREGAGWRLSVSPTRHASQAFTQLGQQC
jgi:trimeric autotransporter adhesin